MSDADDELAFLLDTSEPIEDTVSSNGTGSFYEASEEVPEPDPVLESEPITIGDGQCKICGEPTFRPPGLTKTGRLKRAPIYCDIHNPKIRDRDVPRVDVEAQLRRVNAELADDITLLGTLVGPFFPVTGMYCVDNAETFTTALLTVFKNNARVMRALHRTAQVAPVYQLAKFGAGVGASVQVDKQAMDPHSVMAQRLGVSRAYDLVYSNSNSTVNSTPSNGANSNWNGPPRYATVQ